MTVRRLLAVLSLDGDVVVTGQKRVVPIRLTNRYQKSSTVASSWAVGLIV